MEAPAVLPLAPVKTVRASPPTPLTACYCSDDSKSPEASLVKLVFGAGEGALEAAAQPNATPLARTSADDSSRRASSEKASCADWRTCAEPVWRPDKRRIGDGIATIKWGPDEYEAFASAWQCVRGPTQPADAEPAPVPPETPAPPCLQHEARGACFDAGAIAESGTCTPPRTSARVGSSAGARAWGFAKACWARVRPAKDQAAHAASAASATEDLLASVAVTDVKELARRQTAYVADRRAEGISESFARAMWLHESYALNMRDQLKLQPMTVSLAVCPLSAALDDGWMFGKLGRPRQLLHSL